MLLIVSREELYQKGLSLNQGAPAIPVANLEFMCENPDLPPVVRSRNWFSNLRHLAFSINDQSALEQCNLRLVQEHRIQRNFLPRFKLLVGDIDRKIALDTLDRQYRIAADVAVKKSLDGEFLERTTAATSVIENRGVPEPVKEDRRNWLMRFIFK